MATFPSNTSGWHFGRLCFARLATSCRLEAVNVSSGVPANTSWGVDDTTGCAVVNPMGGEQTNACCLEEDCSGIVMRLFGDVAGSARTGTPFGVSVGHSMANAHPFSGLCPYSGVCPLSGVCLGSRAYPHIRLWSFMGTCPRLGVCPYLKLQSE